MKGFEDAPEGSWFISAKVDNTSIWDGIKTGALKGFSVEGLFDMVELKAQKTEEEIFEDLKALFMGLNVENVQNKYLNTYILLRQTFCNDYKRKIGYNKKIPF
jgi:hypothetical protein